MVKATFSALGTNEDAIESHNLAVAVGSPSALLRCDEWQSFVRAHPYPEYHSISLWSAETMIDITRSHEGA